MSLVYLNGSYLPPEEACLPVSDRGFAYGDGVFTTMKVSGGAPLFLEKHLERLVRDAAAIHLAAPVGEVEAACFGLVSRLGMEDGVLKVVLTRGSGPRGLSTRNVEGLSVVVSASGLPGPRPALRAISVRDDRGSLAAHKTLNYLPNIIALRRAEEAGCEEATFARDGLLLEATTSNLVGEVEGSLLSPPLGGRVLGGSSGRYCWRRVWFGRGICQRMFRGHSTAWTLSVGLNRSSSSTARLCARMRRSRAFSTRSSHAGRAFSKGLE